MAIYNLSGQPLSNAYNLSGNSLSYAYDVSGTEVFRKQVEFTIMTYNVGAWYGYGAVVPSNLADSWYEMQNSIFDKYKPDFVGIQEYYSTIGNYSAEDMIKVYAPYFYGFNKASGVAGRAMASTYAITSPTNNLFVDQDGGELRYYLKGYINVCGKRICIISAHTSYQGAYPYVQCNSLLDVIENEEYFIVVGDMNFRVDELNGENYNLMNKVWIDAGYNSASGPEFGIKKTFYSSGEWHGIDQIFTSSNITINSVIIDDTKTDEYASLVGTRIDHVPLIANVTIDVSGE